MDIKMPFEMTTNTPEPVAWLVHFTARYGGANVPDKITVWRKDDAKRHVREELITGVEPLYPESALQTERERAEILERDHLPAWRLRAEKAEAELAALEVKTWNAAIEAAAEGFELDDGHYYDQVRDSILRLKK